MDKLPADSRRIKTLVELHIDGTAITERPGCSSQSFVSQDGGLHPGNLHDEPLLVGKNVALWWKYDVFVSFKGEDIRNSICSVISTKKEFMLLEMILNCLKGKKYLLTSTKPLKNRGSIDLREGIAVNLDVDALHNRMQRFNENQTGNGANVQPKAGARGVA
ncbi:hypothetical protein Tco_0894062 [Tanacetum coccineum]|uniref:Uncharacterized protein n=1 Tax=Tanacetum coccineum TaxID=301880 RepID=A0ABQ5CB26_9ASTR